MTFIIRLKFSLPMLGKNTDHCTLKDFLVVLTIIKYKIKAIERLPYGVYL